MLKERLKSAKSDAIPAVRSQIAEMIMCLQRELHKYIGMRCGQICKNTECAYDIVLQDIRDKVQHQMDEREREYRDVEQEMCRLQAAVQELEHYQKIIIA